MTAKLNKEKKRAKWTKKKLIILAVAFVIIILLYIWGYMMKVDKYELVSKKLDNDLKIVFISDLHNCFYGGKDQSKLKKEVEKADPDVVIFGGDVLDMWGGTENALTIMEWAAPKYPCIYVCGNHEDMREDKEEFYTEVQKLGIAVPRGDFFAFDHKGQEVRFYGITNYFDELDKCAKTLDDSYYNVLIAHQPEMIDTMLDAGKGKFDLILSGHSHAGQWRIPGILDQGVYAPDQGILPEYTNGIYDYEDGKTTHIISRGLAKPMRMIFIPRIFNRPEFSVIEISADK